MELSQIRYFIAATQYKSLLKASRMLGITQPALSISIAKLEDELGVKLFDRNGTVMKLNENGRRFLDNAIHAVHELEYAVASARNEMAQPELIIGMFQHSDRFLLCLNEFSESNPEVDFQVDYPEIAPRILDTDGYDAIVYPGNPIFQKYKGKLMYSDPYLLAVNKSDPLAGRGSVKLGDIADRKVVFIKHSNTVYGLPYHLCMNLGIHVSHCAFTNSHEIQRQLISNGSGVGFVTVGGSACYSSCPEIVLLPVSEEGFSLEIMVGFKRRKRLGDAGARFEDFVRSYFGL